MPFPLTRRDFLVAAAGAAAMTVFDPRSIAFGAAAKAPSRIVAINGAPTLVVNGAPHLVSGAQCDIWRSIKQDAVTEAFFARHAELNATTVSVGVPWAKIELAPDHYDFAYLDWFIAQARSHGLKLGVNLFNTNVCGKVQDGNGIVYTPQYILGAPDKYQRMVLTSKYPYNWAGPPMCPNDPRTLDRERRYVVALVEHLRDTDTDGTVVLLQLDNEFVYTDWADAKPGADEELSIRCLCPFCNQKWAAGTYADGREFMFRSFADYVRPITDAIHAAYPLPVYLNDPWWPDMAPPIFLENCPNVALIGMDGVFDPSEPNQLSRVQVGRNIPFAAENPTENPKTRFNLDVLPYYTLIGHLGIGNLLWECHPPFTVIDDPEASGRYGAALYPIKHAQAAIAHARGTERLGGWFAMRDIDGKNPARMFVREGAQTRIADGDTASLRVRDLAVGVSGSLAGIVIARSEGDVIVAAPAGRLRVSGRAFTGAESGRFDGSRWVDSGSFPLIRDGGAIVLELAAPIVVRLT